MRVLMPLPDRDFDVTEVAVPWRVLTDAGHRTVFVTERGGTAPAADPRLLSGVLFGRLGAAPEPIAFYRQLERDGAFQAPLCWAELDVEDYDGLLLPGGHAPGMRQYLGNSAVQSVIARFWDLGRPVGAICHGVLALARTVDPSTGRSVIAGRRTTCLTRRMERSAFYLTAWRLGRYYRTYPAYVQDEVVAALDHPGQFDPGPSGPTVGLIRGTAGNDRAAFVVQDGRYLSARWPGDAYLFARRFRDLLDGKPAG